MIVNYFSNGFISWKKYSNFFRSPFLQASSNWVSIGTVVYQYIHDKKPLSNQSWKRTCTMSGNRSLPRSSKGDPVFPVEVGIVLSDVSSLAIFEVFKLWAAAWREGYRGKRAIKSYCPITKWSLRFVHNHTFTIALIPLDLSFSFSTPCCWFCCDDGCWDCGGVGGGEYCCCLCECCELTEADRDDGT